MENKDHLYILWTNADLNTSHLMVLLYATNGMTRRWWDAVTVIIWGATAKLVAEDEGIQQKIAIAQHAGVEFSACIACALQLGVEQKLESLGIDLKKWGPPLTDLLKEGARLLTV